MSKIVDMKNPQTLAEELYSQFPNEKLRNIKDFGCCAFTLLWCLGIEPDDAKAILTLGQLIDFKAIEEDCTVIWAKACQYLTGRNLNVEFKNITSIKDIKKRTPVKYERVDENGKKHAHWVGVENGKIGFNSLKTSLCVNKGKPVTARILTISGGY